MKRKALAAAALSPLFTVVAAGAADAETTIGNVRTTPINTSTVNNGAPDDVDITANGGFSVPSGAAVTLDSNNAVTNEGAITSSNVNNSIAILVKGGATGSLSTTGTISLTETFTATDANGDGVLDAPFAQGGPRYGILLSGAAPFVGSITAGGAITIAGNDSFGVSLEAPLQGGLTSSASFAITGDRSFAVRELAGVSGALTVTGVITAKGQGAGGLDLSGDIGGRVSIYSAVTATGYATTTRSTDPAVVAKLMSTDFEFGGSPVRIAGSVGGGVFVGALGAATTDADGDGIVDNVEGTGVLTSFGSAPAMAIVSAGKSNTLGAFGTGDNAYGLIVRGNLAGNGLFDTFSGTGLQVGDGLGQVLITGGIRITGLIEGSAAQADATGIHLQAGAQVPTIRNEGNILATSTSAGAPNALAILIDQGAAVGAISNTGAISGTINGQQGLAGAVIDRSGSITSVLNSGTIKAFATPSVAGLSFSGRAVALDLSANTSGVALRQVSGAATPSIVGDILLGSGPDNVQFLAGTVAGALSLNSGDDTVTIDNGAAYKGGLTHSGGALTLNIVNGVLANDNPNTIAVAALTVGANATLIVSADPAHGTWTQYQVSGAANLASGARVGLQVQSTLTAPISIPVISASSLSVGAIDTALLGQSPFFYVVNLQTDTTAGLVTLTLRRRTPAEAGLTPAQTAMFDPVYLALSNDFGVLTAFSNASDKTTFLSLFNQMAPLDYSGGVFAGVRKGLETISQTTAERAAADPPRGSSDFKVSLWTKEFYFGVQKSLDLTARYSSNGFGLVGGVEGSSAHRVLGLTLSLLTSQLQNSDLPGDTQENWYDVEGGFNFREAFGPVRADARVGVGYVGLKSRRDLSSTGATAVEREAAASWSGLSLSGHFGLGGELDRGAFYLRPQAQIDYTNLREDAHVETGGGDAFDLQFAPRRGDSLDATASVVAGFNWSSERNLKWGPRLEAGWRDTVNGDAGDTVGNFAGGQTFTLSPDPITGSGPIARIGVTALSNLIELNFSVGGEMIDKRRSADASATVRVTF